MADNKLFARLGLVDASQTGKARKSKTSSTSIGGRGSAKTRGGTVGAPASRTRSRTVSAQGGETDSMGVMGVVDSYKEPPASADTVMTDVVPSQGLPPSGSSTLLQIKLEGDKKRKKFDGGVIDVTESPPRADISQSVFGVEKILSDKFSQEKLPSVLLPFFSGKGPIDPVTTLGNPVGDSIDAVGRCWTSELNDLMDHEEHAFSLAVKLASQSAVAISGAQTMAEKLRAEVSKLRITNIGQETQVKELNAAYIAAAGDRDKWKKVADTARAEIGKLKSEMQEALKTIKEKEEQIEDAQDSFVREKKELQDEVVKVTKELKQVQDSFAQSMERVVELETLLESPAHNPRVLTDLLYVTAYADLIRSAAKEKNDVAKEYGLKLLKDHMKGCTLDSRVPQPFMDLEVVHGIDMKWWPSYSLLSMPGEPAKLADDAPVDDDEFDDEGMDLLGVGPDGKPKDPLVTPGDGNSTS